MLAAVFINEHLFIVLAKRVVIGKELVVKLTSLIEVPVELAIPLAEFQKRRSVRRPLFRKTPDVFGGSFSEQRAS